MTPGHLDIVTLNTDENGVTTEDRLHLNNDLGCLHIKEWSPLSPPPEDLWQSSPFSDGRVLAMRKYGNAADEFVLNVEADDPDTVNAEIRHLRALIKKAVEYWVEDWTTEPVWLEMRGDGEAITRFAYLYAGDAPQETNPFEPPRASWPSLVNDFRTILEHGFWMDSLAGSCVELSATQDYYDASDNNYVPTQSADDCYIDAGAFTINLNAVNLLFGRSAALLYSCGVRFRVVDIPQGALIFKAYVRMRAVVNQAVNNVILAIAGDDADDSAIFSTYANFAGRARTAAVVPWNPVPAFVAGTDYDTPDLSGIVQEVVGRPGWVLNNNLSILFDNNGSTDGAYRSIYSWDDAAAPAPILYVWWYDTATHTFGQTATCEPLYFADRHNQAQLTHAFAYDTSAGTYSANKIGAALPYTLFPAVPGIGDILYLICATAIPNSGPFGSAVFDLSVVDAGMTGVWEYWNGAWVGTVGEQDFLSEFRTLGVNEVSWLQALDWITTTINLVTGYIVRFRVTAVGAGVPTQQNRQIYAVNTPYIDIDPTQVGGDTGMLADLKIYERTIAISGYGANFVIAALRSLKRGLNFTPYINLADEQNPVGITISAGAAAFASDPTSETGRAIFWNSGSTNWTGIGNIVLGGVIAPEYIGSFMTYLRMRLTGAESHYQFKYTLGFGGETIYESPIATPEVITGGTNDSISICSFGEMGIPMDPALSLTNVLISIFGKVDNIAYDVYLHTFITMPNDEWIGQYTAKSPQGMLNYDKYLSVNPFSQIKLSEVATIRDISDGYTYLFWDDKSPHLPMVREKNRQRLWLFHPATFGGGTRAAFCSHIGKIEIDAIQKYFSSITL